MIKQRVKGQKIHKHFHNCTHPYDCLVPLFPLPPSVAVSNSITAFNPNEDAPVLPQQETDMFSFVLLLTRALIGLLHLTDWDEKLWLWFLQHPCQVSTVGTKIWVHCESFSVGACGYYSFCPPPKIDIGQIFNKWCSKCGHKTKSHTVTCTSLHTVCHNIFSDSTSAVYIHVLVLSLSFSCPVTVSLLLWTIHRPSC